MAMQLQAYISVFLKCQFLMFYTHKHKHKHIHINIHTYSHTHTTFLHKALSKIYYKCGLVISGYHKSYQQYFDILLNYIKLEKFIAIKRNKISK